MNRVQETAGAAAIAAPAVAPLSRLGLLPRLLCRLLMSQVRIDAGAVEHVRDLAGRGAVVYVMRYRSVVDTLLVLCVLLREGLPVPHLLADLSTLWLRPASEILAVLWNRLWVGRASAGGTFEDWKRCRDLVVEGRPVLIFMRDRAAGVRLLGGRERVLRRARRGADYLREIVIAEWVRPGEVFLVPLAVLRGRGYRRRGSRLAALLYTVQEAPGEMKRLVSLLWNRKDTSITVGKHIDLREMIGRHRDEGAERIVKRVSRALQIFLYREEKVVLGPMLLPKRAVREIVLREAEVQEAIAREVRRSGKPEARVQRAAERYFDEMAANFHGSYFAFLKLVFDRIWVRMFHGLDTRGLEKVIECVKLHPVVLVPCHRSHFDYLILSYVFHSNYLTPPHIAAGINLSFWPLGPLFRGAGAYFIRRSFGDDEVYKAVFRGYMKYLIREGYTQEFFIEGGRSRTGKILTPKLGMLSAIVGAFLEGVRRDLYLVPISIHYGRVVEEQAYSRELSGAEKEKESLWGLLRARSVLRQKYGTVFVSFADPISLRAALGERKEVLRSDPEERRRFVQKLGFRILREVNAVAVAGSTSVSATVLLSSPRPAWRYSEFLPAAQQLVQLLRRQGVALTAALERNERDFQESLAFLEYSGLVRRLDGGAVIHVPAEKRVNLDFYKNNTIHFFLLPALLCQVLRAGARGETFVEHVRWWLDLYRWEFPLPERETLGPALARIADVLRQQGALSQDEVDLAHPLGKLLLRVIDNFHEAYWMTARTVARIGPEGMAEKAFRAAVARAYETALLLGEVSKPEGRSTVTIGNALSRFAELQLIEVQLAGRSRERVIRRGPRVGELASLLQRLQSAAGEAEFYR